MTTLVEHIIVAGAENHPPMLEKSMYDSWASRICLFIKGKKHGRMMLDLIDNGPLVYPTVEENGKTRPKKYPELIEAQQLQDDCDVQATNIILHGLPPDGETLYEYYLRFSQLINDMHTIGMIMQQTLVSLFLHFNKEKIRLNALIKQWHSNLLWHQGFHLQTINSERLLIPGIKQPFKMAESQFNMFKKDNLRVLLALEIEELLQLQGEIMQLTEYLDAYDSDCDDLSSAKAVLMANLSSYDSDVLYEVPYSDSSPNDMINQDVQEMQYSKQTHIYDFHDNEIHSDSNIILYSQYLQESQDAVI
ncbi:hypothetical protein Tco_1162139 [Tanacetum coccineum]